MEDNLTNQEEQLKALSEEFSIEVDTGELWGKVEAQLPPVDDRRQRPVFWWFASGILLITIAFFIWNHQSTAEQKEVIAELTQLSTPQSESKITSESEMNTAIHSTSKDMTNSTEPVQSKPTQIKNTKTPALLETVSEKIQENSSTIFNSNRYDEKSTLRKEVMVNQGPIAPSAIDALVNPSSKMTPDANHPIENIKRDVLSYELINSIALNAIESDSRLKFQPKQIVPIKVANWLPFYAIYSGVNMHQKEIKSNVGEGLNLAQFEKERSLLGISTDMQFGFENRNGWRFALGLNHNRLVNRFEQLETVSESTEIEGNSTSKIDGEGNTTHISGTLTLNTVTAYDINWHRTHDFVNAQLMVGKRIFGSDNFSVFSDASIGRNIWSNHSGYYFTEGSQTINKFDSSDENPYSNAGYNVGVNLSLEYSVGAISLSLRPFASMGLNSMTQNTNYYQLKNSQYGVQLGVVYRP